MQNNASKNMDFVIFPVKRF